MVNLGGCRDRFRYADRVERYNKSALAADRFARGRM